MTRFDAVIIGAGGAGLMCAIQAARRGKQVAVLDHAATIGKKILISGGGRCNFTNIHTTSANYVSRNPHFCKSALARFTPEDFLELVRAKGIPFYEKKLGQLFCKRSARDIVDLLVGECEKAGLTIRLGCQIQEVQQVQKVQTDEMTGNFLLDTSLGSFSCASLVVATGGLSVPPAGATDLGYRLAGQFGLAIVEPEPALVGLRFTKQDLDSFGLLAGVSVETIVTCGPASFRENILFTHNGLSGPAILQASLYWRKGEPITITLFPDLDLASWLLDRKKQGEKAELKTLLAIHLHLPKRLAEKLCDLHLPSKLPSRSLALLSDRHLEAFAQTLQRWRIIPADTEGFKKAEVTRGGVDTAELSSKTMEASKVPGLYFIGEVVDVTGQLGGFNFQWAWASGWAAGQAL
jgi:predicted Rossmann fold flavoprotein